MPRSGSAEVPQPKEKGNREPAASPTNDVPAFTSAQVARMCGISLRQLQWWDERNLVRPLQMDRKRYYTGDQVVAVSVVAQLRRKGIPLQRMRKVLLCLRTLRHVRPEGGTAYLLTRANGTEAWLRFTAEGVVDTMKQARQPMVLAVVGEVKHA